MLRRMPGLDSALDDWKRRRDAFRWEVPDAFNFGSDVVEHFAREPARPALLWRGSDGSERRLTYADVARAANRFAHLLRSLGVAPGDPVVVMLPKIPEWQIALVGALEVGCLVIPSSTILRPKDIEYRVNHSRSVVLVTTAEQAAAVDEVREHTPTLKHRLLLGADRPGWLSLEPALAAQPDDASARQRTRASDPALVYYTSGTTGPPKAVLHTHAYTWAQRYTASFWLGLRGDDRLWTTSDTGWAKAAYSVIFGPWSVGAEVFMYGGRFEPQRELELLEEIAPQVFCAPPTEYRLLIKEPKLADLRVPRLRECVSAGEPLNPEVIRTWQEKTGLTIRDGFGQTESILLIGNFPGNPVRPGSMGLPMPGHDLAVIDDSGRVLPPDEVGDVALRGSPPSLFREYWKDDAATARTRRGDWYVTGDRGFVDADGYFWFVGRADDVIISAGYRIGPFEVESALIEHPDVMEAAAVAAPDPDRGSVVKAYVVLRAGVRGDDTLVRSLQDHVKAVTAPYKYPRQIEFVSGLPKTVSGKIRRVELREQAQSSSLSRNLASTE
jgi:acetyl-CoA synthetase/medium-chain acyl-CoA synthetase